MALLTLTLMVIAGCAPAGSGPAVPPDSPDHRWSAFEQRATEVAEAWRAMPAWRTGYVPLQDPTVLVGDSTFTVETKTAFGAGWYRDQIGLPSTRPADGTIRFPDGALTVPLVSAAEAYGQLDQGDPPPCEGRPKEPGTPPAEPSGGPDDAVSSTPETACIPLTVTAAELGTVPLLTSRGEVRVPAWLFTVEEISGTVARVAVAPEAVVAVPEPTAPARSVPDDVAGAHDLRAVDGATLTWQLGVGACDTGITPLVQEHDHVVVVGGGFIRSTEMCPAVLKLEPVTATLKAPLGDRPVLDVLTGRPLSLTTA